MSLASLAPKNPCVCGHDRSRHQVVQGFYGPCTTCKSCSHYAVTFSQVGRRPVETKEK